MVFRLQKSFKMTSAKSVEFDLPQSPIIIHFKWRYMKTVLIFMRECAKVKKLKNYQLRVIEEIFVIESHLQMFFEWAIFFPVNRLFRLRDLASVSSETGSAVVLRMHSINF